MFLVADSQLYKRLCPAVGPSAGPSVMLKLKTKKRAPAHPSKTILWPRISSDSSNPQLTRILLNVLIFGNRSEHWFSIKRRFEPRFFLYTTQIHKFTLIEVKHCNCAVSLPKSLPLMAILSSVLCDWSLISPPLLRLTMLLWLFFFSCSNTWV